eukprot:gene3311-13338_t
MASSCLNPAACLNSLTPSTPGLSLPAPLPSKVEGHGSANPRSCLQAVLNLTRGRSLPTLRSTNLGVLGFLPNPHSWLQAITLVFLLTLHLLHGISANNPAAGIQSCPATPTGASSPCSYTNPKDPNKGPRHYDFTQSSVQNLYLSLGFKITLVDLNPADNSAGYQCGANLSSTWIGLPGSGVVNLLKLSSISVDSLDRECSSQAQPPEFPRPPNPASTPIPQQQPTGFQFPRPPPLRAPPAYSPDTLCKVTVKLTSSQPSSSFSIVVDTTNLANNLNLLFSSHNGVPIQSGEPGKPLFNPHLQSSSSSLIQSTATFTSNEQADLFREALTMSSAPTQLLGTTYTLSCRDTIRADFEGCSSSQPIVFSGIEDSPLGAVPGLAPCPSPPPTPPPQAPSSPSSPPSPPATPAEPARPALPPPYLPPPPAPRPPPPPPPSSTFQLHVSGEAVSCTSMGNTYAHALFQFIVQAGLSAALVLNKDPWCADFGVPGYVILSAHFTSISAAERFGR